MNYLRKGLALFLVIVLVVSNAFALEPLKLGSKGQEVKKMQMRLKELGFYDSGIDGDFGNRSKEAIKAFQAKNGLEQDGNASIETLELLYSDKAISKNGKNDAVKSTENQTVVSVSEPYTPGLTKDNFSRFWNDKLNYQAASDAFISMAYGGSPSVIYSYDIRISESSNTASFIITCYNPKSYTKERISEYYNEFISSILKTVGYQNTKTDWIPYITYGMSGSKNHVYINGYDFYFYTKTTHEYPNYAGKNGVDMLEYHLDVSKVNKPKFIYETIADVYCISGVASCGDTLTLPSEVQGKIIEGIIINKPYSIYDENIKTIVIGSQMHTVPVSTLNMVFPSLEAFVVGNNNPYIAQIDGCLYNKKVKTLIACPATKTELTIPEGIVGIEHFACQYAKELTKVEIPSTCTIIGTSAFEECTSLKEIKFAESSSWVIEEKAFYGCTSLSEIDLSGTLCVEIESNAFAGCTNLTKLQLPNTLKKIGNNAFENSLIKEIILPDGLETIGESVFGSELRNVSIPATVKEFYPTSFTPYCMVSVASNNEYYYEKDGVVFSKANELLFYPYNTKKDTAYEIPSGTTAILCNLGSHLTKLTIPSSVKAISVGFNNGITLQVESGSYAESYAIEKQYNYESKIVESNDLDWLHTPSAVDSQSLTPTVQAGLQHVEAEENPRVKKLEDIVLANMSLSEMLALEEKVLAAMKLTDDWQEVHIPAGLYKVGTDIPAAHWQIQPLDSGYAYVKYGDKLDDTGSRLYGASVYGGLFDKNHREYIASKNTTSLDIDFKTGCYFEVDNAGVIFTPYIGKNIRFITDEPPVELEYEVDFGNANLSGLEAVRSLIHRCMWESDEWKEVWLPAGLYYVGIDVLAGHWQIAPHVQGYTYIKYGNKLDNTGSRLYGASVYGGLFDKNHREYIASKNTTSIDIEFKTGCYFEVDNAGVVITRYEKKNLGFK